MNPSANCTALVKSFEGFLDHAYRCPAGVWTIGYGTTVYPDGHGVQPGDQCSRAQAEDWLAFELAEKSKAVSSVVKVALTQNQFDALASFAYNVGSGAFAKSTMLKKINAGDMQGAADQFPLWNKGGGQVLPGLVKRRAAERALFLKG